MKKLFARAWAWLTYGPCAMRLIMAVVVTPLILWLSGCTTEAPRVTGTAHAVAINWANSDPAHTLPTAEAHCAKYGKHAQFPRKTNDFTAAFNRINP